MTAETSSKRTLSDVIGRLSTQEWGLIFLVWGCATAPLIAAFAPLTHFWSGAFWGALISVVFGMYLILRGGSSPEVDAR